MSGGKKKRETGQSELDPKEKELFLKAFFEGEIPSEEDKKEATKSPVLEESEKKLFLEAATKGIGYIPKKDFEKKFTRPKNRAQRRGMPDAIIDLHGMSELDAKKALLDFLKYELGRGSKSVLVIHGKGSGILRDAVWALIERHSGVVDFQVAGVKLGGEGALLVRLNRKPKGRRNF